MRHIMSVAVMALALSAASPARAGETYRLQVDGLACPFCAYGVEKKLNDSEGVEAVDIRINEGVVLVTVSEGVRFDEARAEQIMEEAGFTLSGFEKTARVVE